jgi:hypothetical protein
VANFFVNAMDEHAIDALTLQRSRVQAPLQGLCLLSSGIGIAAWLDPAQLLTLLLLLLLPLLIFRAANSGGAVWV